MADVKLNVSAGSKIILVVDDKVVICKILSIRQARRDEAACTVESNQEPCTVESNRAACCSDEECCKIQVESSTEVGR